MDDTLTKELTVAKVEHDALTMFFNQNPANLTPSQVDRAARRAADLAAYLNKMHGMMQVKASK